MYFENYSVEGTPEGRAASTKLMQSYAENVISCFSQKSIISFLKSPVLYYAPMFPAEN